MARAGEAREAAQKCRSCRKGRYAPPVHMVKLTEAREITPYRWVHPDDDLRLPQAPLIICFANFSVIGWRDAPLHLWCINT